MPPIYIAKYNKFVDNIIGRINKILGKSYDPVRVKLQSPQTKKITKTKKQKKKSNKRTKTKEVKNKMGNLEISRTIESEAREPTFILISKNGETVEKQLPNFKKAPLEIRAKTNKRTKVKSKKNKTKTKSSSSKAPKVRATLFGLSSLRRDGDVTVNMKANFTTVKTDFILGPLTLRVEKEFGKGARRELKSATATTAEMLGKLNLRIVHGGAATLHNIKVLQPKQVS